MAVPHAPGPLDLRHDARVDVLVIETHLPGGLVEEAHGAAFVVLLRVVLLHLKFVVKIWEYVSAGHVGITVQFVWLRAVILFGIGAECAERQLDEVLVFFFWEKKSASLLLPLSASFMNLPWC